MKYLRVVIFRDMISRGWRVEGEKERATILWRLVRESFSVVALVLL